MKKSVGQVVFIGGSGLQIAVVFIENWLSGVEVSRGGGRHYCQIVLVGGWREI